MYNFSVQNPRDRRHDAALTVTVTALERPTYPISLAWNAAGNHVGGAMLYNPRRDLYELLAVSSEASEDQIRFRIDGLRGVKDDRGLDEAASVLLHLESRTRYDTLRATQRMRRLLREGVAVFSGRTPAFGVPTSDDAD